MSGIFTIAVHALVYLNHRQETLSSEELSENIWHQPCTGAQSDGDAAPRRAGGGASGKVWGIPLRT